MRVCTWGVGWGSGSEGAGVGGGGACGGAACSMRCFDVCSLFVRGGARGKGGGGGGTLPWEEGANSRFHTGCG